MPDYIPSGDGDFNQWLTNYANVVGAAPAAYGIDATDLDDVNAAKAVWDAAFPDATAKEQAAMAATTAKTNARRAVEQAVRPLVKKIQAEPSVTDEAKAAAGLTVPDTTQTVTGPPTSRPVAEVDTSQRLRHTVKFRDESTPTSRAKPQGVRGCEIWVKVGDPAPTNKSDLAFETLDTRTPHTIDFDGGDAGRTAHYWLRWISTRGEAGPWSAPVSATITG